MRINLHKAFLLDEEKAINLMDRFRKIMYEKCAECPYDDEMKCVECMCSGIDVIADIPSEREFLLFNSGFILAKNLIVMGDYDDDKDANIEE